MIRLEHFAPNLAYRASRVTFSDAAKPLRFIGNVCREMGFGVFYEEKRPRVARTLHGLFVRNGARPQRALFLKRREER